MVVGIIFYILAEIFTDTIQENFFKNFVFSDYYFIPKKDDCSTWKYNNLFVKKSPKMLGEDITPNNKFLDYKFTEIELINLMTSARAEVVKQDIKPYSMHNKYGDDYYGGCATMLTISVSCNMFIYSPEQLEFEIYFISALNNGRGLDSGDAFLGVSKNHLEDFIDVKKVGNKKSKVYSVDSIILEDKKGGIPPAIRIDLSFGKYILDGLVTDKILFIFRLKLDADKNKDNLYAPTSHDREELYFGTELSLYKSRSDTGTSVSEFIIAPKKRFLDLKAWPE